MRTGEQQYLSELIHAVATGRDQAPLLPASVEWQQVRHMLFRHGIVSPVAPLMLNGGMTGEFKNEVRAMTRPFQRHGALLLLELNRFVPWLERYGCRPLVLKGAALAHTVYDPATVRCFKDLDILVAQGTFDTACEVLDRFGYEPCQTLRHPEFYLRHHFHRIFKNRAGVTVELHWDLSRPSDYYRFDVKGLFQRAERREVNGHVLRVPSNADQLLHGACQANQEGFLDLRRVLDGALLLRAGAGDDPGLVRRAREQGIAPSLWLLLRLIRSVAGVTVSPNLVEHLQPTPLQRTCLESLDLPHWILGSARRSEPRLRNLVRWLCAPSLSAAIGEFARFVFPTRTQLLDDGHAPDQLPRSPRRALITAKRAAAAAAIGGFQCWRLALHAAHRR